MMLRKFKGSSMMESVVAMVIISIVFVLSLSVYLNISDFSFSFAEVNARLKLDALAIETRKNKTFFDEDSERESMVMKKEIRKYKDLNDVFWLHLEALTKDGKVIAERNELIYSNEEK